MFGMLVLTDTTEGVLTRGEAGGVFVGEEIYRSSRSLSGGMAAGDPDRDGDIEVAFCDFEGNVILLEPRETGGFDPIFIWQVEGPQGSNKTLFDLLVADVDPNREGVEIITAGDAGSPLKQIYLLWYNGTGWESEVIHSGLLRTFDLDLADIDPAPGKEILFGSFKHEEDFALHYLYRDGDLWKERSIPTTEAVKAVTYADADPTVPGKEIWACIAGWNDDGGVESHLVEIYHDGSDWVEKIIYTHDTELISNVRIGELWSEHDGNEIVIAELSGWCRVLYYEEGASQITDIFRADTIAGQFSGLEGLAIGDFNPIHPGEEAVVTGYYNKVTQIIEVDGEMVDDLAWSKDVSDARLEISGVEVIDVLPDSPGNEVLVASLQGWIELLKYQDDGIAIEGDTTYFEIEDGKEKDVDIDVLTEGRFTGTVTLTADHSDDLTVTMPSTVELQFMDTETITVNIEADDLGRERTSYVNITAVGGGHSTVFTLYVDVVLLQTLSLSVSPPVGRIYQEGVNTFSAEVSVQGGERYDLLQMTATSVEGFAVNIDSPMNPEETTDLTVSVQGNPDVGPHTISISGLYNGVSVAQGSMIVTVVSLAQSFDSTIRPVVGEKNRHIVSVNFTGPDPVRLMEVEVMFGEDTIFKESMDLTPGQSLPVTFPVEKGQEGDVIVSVRSLAGALVYQKNLGPLEFEEDEEKLDIFNVFLIVFVIVLAIVVILVGYFMFIKPAKQVQEEDLEGIGGPSRYAPGRGPLGPERRKGPSERVRGGRMQREELPPRGGGRRAPPRPESQGPPPRNDGIRRAREAPDHMRPGGRQREVRRAPPRR